MFVDEEEPLAPGVQAIELGRTLGAPGPVRTRRRKIVFGVLYWLAVLIVSIALLIGLILLLESRDSSSVGGAITALAR